AAMPVVLLAQRPAWAQLFRYWDANGATAGAGGPGPTGTWGTSSFWTADSAGTTPTGNWIPGFDAVFAAGTDATDPYIVNVVGSQVIGSITFEEGQPALVDGGGGAFPLSGAVNFNASSVGGISVLISGTGSLQKTGSGTLVLFASNSYSGGTSIQ